MIKEEIKTIDEIQVGDVIEVACGKRYLVMEMDASSSLYGMGKDGYISLEGDFKKDMTSKLYPEKYNIIGVYRAPWYCSMDDILGGCYYEVQLFKR